LSAFFKNLIPKDGIVGKTASLALKAIMSVKVWSKWFPTLGDEYGSTK